jgi:hypothetical protein
MGTASNILNFIFDALLYPFGWLPAIFGLLFISITAGIGMIFLFKAVSDQDRISSLRRRMGGEVMGILLHVSSPMTVIRFAARLIWSNTLYLGHLLKPVLYMAVPFMIVWGQLDARYGASPPGEDLGPVTVTVQYYGGLPPGDSLEISASGMELLQPVMRIDTLHQVSFRVMSSGDGKLEVDGTRIPFGKTGQWNGSRILRGFDSHPSLMLLLRPWIEASGGDEDITGSYSLPGADYRILSWFWSWEAVFLVFSMLAALAGARIMRVKI